MSFLFGVCFIISKCMRTMSGCVFIIDKRRPDPRLMSGQIHLRNYTFYFYDLQHVGLGSSKNKAARSRVEKKQEVNTTCCMLKHTHIPEALLSVYITAKCWILMLGWNVYAQKQHFSWIMKTMKHREKVAVHSSNSSSCSYSLHLQQTYILL